MKKINLLLFICIFLISSMTFAKTGVISFTGFSGGSTGDLDKVSCADILGNGTNRAIATGDIAFGIDSALNIFAIYQYDSTGTDVEGANGTYDPIVPDDRSSCSSQGQWNLVTDYRADLADSASINLNDGSTYTNFSTSATDDTINELFAAVDIGIGTKEPVISVPATYVADAGARMDSEHVSAALTISANPTQITYTSGVWEDIRRASGGTTGWAIQFLETNVEGTTGKTLGISNVDAANIYIVADSPANVENPWNKTVSIRPGETAWWVYIIDRWYYMKGGNYDPVISSINIGALLTVDGTYSGNTITLTVDSGQSNTLFGQAYHLDTDGELIEADADVATSGAAPAICLAVQAGTGAKECLLMGQICETAWDWTVGGKIYLSDDPATTQGLTQTPPATTGDQVQPLGIALSGDTIYFNPTLDTVEVP